MLAIEHPVIITARNSFHGRTVTAVSATGQSKYQANFGPLTPGFEYVPYNDLPALEALVSSINGEGGPSGRRVAGVLMESLQGEGGVLPGDRAFFRGIRRLCDATGALMMMDEVQTGMGRTGKLWGYEQLDVLPDVFTSAKALGGGVPIGAMCCQDRFNVFLPGDHASTYGGNPLACAAGLAVADVFGKERVLDNVQARGEQFRALARAVQARHPGSIQEVRGWGLINGVELRADSALTAADVTKQLMLEGMLVVPAGPKVVRFVPPLIVTAEQVEDSVRKLEQAIQVLTAST